MLITAVRTASVHAKSLLKACPKYINKKERAGKGIN